MISEMTEIEILNLIWPLILHVPPSRLFSVFELFELKVINGFG